MREALTNLRLKCRALWRRRRLESDLEDELAFHLAMREEKNRQAGVTESARRSFGNPALVKEELRDQWTFPSIENLWRDLRYAGRMLRRSPGFTLVAILSLAIGIGGSTTTFSLVDAILLKSLPVRDPEQLRVVLSTGEGPYAYREGYRVKNRAGIWVSSPFPYSTYRQFLSNAPQFSDFVGFAWAPVTVIAGAASHYADAELVSGNFFTSLGVTALGGRTLTPEDDRSSAPPLAVISYRYWERHLGLDPEAVGRAILVNGRPVTVVGITPRAFLGLRPGSCPDLYLPISLASLFAPKWYRLDDEDNAWVEVMGRLRPGVGKQQALAALGAVMQRVAAAAQRKSPGTEGPWRPVLEDGAGGILPLRNSNSVFSGLLVLSSVVGIVLLIACANLANLLLARGASRRREIAVRLSIGAGRLRLIRQLLAESFLLAGVGAALGLMLAAPLAGLIVRVVGGDPALLNVYLDWRALLFTAGAALVTVLLFGLTPACRATRVDLTPALKDGPGGVAAGPRLQARASRLLIAGQVALSTVLLAGAGLFVRTLMNLSSVDPGFQTQRLLLFNVDGSLGGYQGDKLQRLYERIREKVEVIPGVQSATLSDYALISRSYSNIDMTISGYAPKDGKSPSPLVMRVGGRFFSTIGIPILLGRGLDDRDGAKAPKTGIVNETFARSYLAGRSPIGQYIWFGGGKNPPPTDRIEIVGVCRDAKYYTLRNETSPTVYLPYLQARDFNKGMTFELRTVIPPMAISSAVQHVVAEIDRSLPVAEMRTQEEQIRRTLGAERMFAGVVGSFGMIAALLAAIGLYGVMAYAVTRRTNEIGIRLALGAGRAGVQWMVLRDSLWMVAIGLAAGIPAALALTQVVRQNLYGIKPNDPASFVAAAALMVAVAAAAAWIPARRAAGLDPMRALRCE